MSACVLVPALPDLSESFIHVTFPNGSSYVVRRERSGVVMDSDGAPIDLELAVELLTYKCWKFCQGGMIGGLN